VKIFTGDRVTITIHGSQKVKITTYHTTHNHNTYAMQSCAGIRIVVTKLANTGYTLTPKKVYVPEANYDYEVIKSINKTWHVSEFDKVRQPLIIGSVPNFGAKLNRAVG
jgi:hypothetical protein